MGGLPLIPPTRRELGQLGDDTGFPPTQLDKVVRLLALVDDIFDDPYLGGLVSLTGGTALNMFVLPAPRLSFDLDLNYIATPDRDVMKAERPRFEAAMRSLFEAHDLELKRAPSGKAHAGGKWDLRYRTAWGHRDSIAVDVSYVRRVPLWSPTRRDSHRLGRWQATGVAVADVHELAAGKLNAFYKRALPRDLFDVGLIPSLPGLDPSKLRTAFVVYGAGARPDWRVVCAATPTVTPADLAAQLRATLPRAEASRTRLINVGVYLAELANKAIPAQRMVVLSTQLSRRSWMGYSTGPLSARTCSPTTPCYDGVSRRIPGCCGRPTTCESTGRRSRWVSTSAPTPSTTTAGK